MRRVLEHVVEWKEMHDEMVKDFKKAEFKFQKEHRSKQVSMRYIQLRISS